MYRIPQTPTRVHDGLIACNTSFLDCNEAIHQGVYIQVHPATEIDEVLPFADPTNLLHNLELMRHLETKNIMHTFHHSFRE